MATHQKTCSSAPGARHYESGKCKKAARVSQKQLQRKHSTCAAATDIATTVYASSLSACVPWAAAPSTKWKHCMPPIHTHLVAQKLWQIHQRRCQSMWHARISSGCWLTVSYCNKYKLLVGLPSSWHVAATTNCMPQCTIEWCTQFNCDFWLIAFRHLIGRMLLSCS